MNVLQLSDKILCLVINFGVAREISQVKWTPWEKLVHDFKGAKLGATIDCMVMSKLCLAKFLVPSF